jgi:CRP-like cAMP-binding protein
LFKLLEAYVPTRNLLLAALPPDDYSRFVPQLNLVRLAQGQIIYHLGDTIRHAYFPLNGVLSLLHIMEDGHTLEVAMVGREGMVGIPAILKVNRIPYQVVALSATYAMRVQIGSLDREFSLGEGLHDLLLGHLRALLAQVSQSAGCGHFHTVEQRLCCWLLAGRERVESNHLDFTHEILSHMLGVSRTRVTMHANNIQRARLISYRRGKITLLNVQGLEALACKCCRVFAKNVNEVIAA